LGFLDFPKQFDPPAEVVTLEQNYRSTQPILDACNAVMSLVKERSRCTKPIARGNSARAWQQMEIRSTGARLLRENATRIGLKSSFTILDRSDAAEKGTAEEDAPLADDLLVSVFLY
jgi:superfamily I DNA/RNA helicase